MTLPNPNLPTPYTYVPSKKGPTSRVKFWDGKEPLPVGQPTKFSKELGMSCLDSIVQGKTLTKWCQENELTLSTVWRWGQENDEFRSALARAREAQAEAWADECVKIADDTSRDLIETKPGVIIANNAAPHRDKLRIDHRMRMAGIFNPAFRQNDGSQINVQINNSVDAPRAETREEWLSRQAKPGPK